MNAPEKQARIIAGIVGLLAGGMALFSQVKSAAIKVLAVNTIESKELEITGDNQAIKHSNSIAEPNTNLKIQNIIKAKKADTFSGSWKVIPNRERIRSVFFASVTSIAIGRIIYGASRKTITSEEEKSLFWAIILGSSIGGMLGTK